MWNELPEADKVEYKNFILAFASLTEAFAQKADGDATPSPIINSKYQETVFQKAFKAVAEDIGNSSFDASILLHKEDAPDEKYVVGIKKGGRVEICNELFYADKDFETAREENLLNATIALMEEGYEKE